MGNTLEKPGMILKRKKVKDTVEEEEKLEKAILGMARPDNKIRCWKGYKSKKCKRKVYN